MFWTGLVVGLIVGANVSLVLYACIIAGKKADEKEWLFNKKEKDKNMNTNIFKRVENKEIKVNFNIRKKGNSFFKLLRGKFSMEEKLLELIKLADTLNEKQDKVFAEIKYEADDSKTLRISIRKKDDYKYVECCEMQMRERNLIKWNSIIELLKSYIENRTIKIN